MKDTKANAVGRTIASYQRWLPIIIAMAIYAFFAWRNQNFAIDDGMIYLRYINNFVHGHGLVYNPGVRFNGLTSPGYTLPLALLALITQNPKLSAWLICTFAGFFGLMAWYSVFRNAFSQLRLSPRASACYAYASLLLSLVLPFFFLTYDMETTLFVFVSGLLVKAYLDKNFATAAFLAGWLVCIRLEGGALLLGMVVHQLAFRRRLPSRIPQLLMLFVLVPVLVFGFNFIYYGTPFSGTGMVKLWQGQSGLWGTHSFIHPPSFLYAFVFGNSKLALIGLCALSLIGLAALWRNAIAIIVIVYLVVYTGVFTLLNIPNYHWYYYPYFLVLPFLALYGAAYLAAEARRLSRHGFGALVALAAIVPVCASAYYSMRYDLHPSPPDGTYISIGKWLKNHTPSTAKVALPEIGFVGYYSDRYIIDTLGLVDRYNGKMISQKMFDGWLVHYHPDYILVHTPAWWPLEYGLYAAAARYGVSEVCDFDFPPYRLFKVDGISGTGTTCDGGHWLPIGNDAPPESGKPTPDFIGHVGEVQIMGNVVRAQVNPDSQRFPLTRFAIHDQGAYGMARPARMPIKLTGTAAPSDPVPAAWRLVVFFPTVAAAHEWSKSPTLSAVDEHGNTYHFGPAVAQSQPYADLFSAGVTNSQCSLDAIDGKPSADVTTVTAGSTSTFGGWAGNGHGTAVNHGLLIFRGKPQTYTIPFVTVVGRPDVAKALNSAGMARSGYNLTATLKGVPAGTYSLFVTESKNPATTCNLHRTLTVQ